MNDAIVLLCTIYIQMTRISQVSLLAVIDGDADDGNNTAQRDAGPDKVPAGARQRIISSTFKFTSRIEGAGLLVLIGRDLF